MAQSILDTLVLYDTPIFYTGKFRAHHINDRVVLLVWDNNTHSGWRYEPPFDDLSLCIAFITQYV